MMDSDMLAKVEAQRVELETKIAKLKKSLHHWQTLELDYEGLREEFDLLPEDSSPKRCLQVAREFGAALLDERELESLLKDTKSSRTPPQLAQLLSKRVEYVGKNLESLRKQIIDAEKKRNALLLAEDPEHRDDAGLPLTEITEELDESGNVVSSRVERPGGATAGLIDVLDMAGVQGLKLEDIDPAATQEQSRDRATVESNSHASTTEPDAHHDSMDEISTVDETIPQSATAKAAHQSSIGVDQNQLPPLNPFDTADEARLREEMLDYQGLDEIGAIVAELDLAEGLSEGSYDPDEDDLLIGSDFGDDDDDDASEDETGKTKSPAVSAAYKDKMEKLKKNLGLHDMKNLGPNPNFPPNIEKDLNRPSAAEAAGKAAIARQKTSKSAMKAVDEDDGQTTEAKPKKKSVAFANSLGIVEEVPPAEKSKLPVRSKDKAEVNPLSESVIERSKAGEDDAPPPPAPPSTSNAKKVSRFKKDKQTAAQSSNTTSRPEQEQNLRPLIAPQILERKSTTDPSKYQPPDPDSIDDELHRRELALEYHKLRNRRIHDQGGYVQHQDEDGDEEDFDDATQDYGIVDPETGQWRKVSRFKAARVRG